MNAYFHIYIYFEISFLYAYVRDDEIFNAVPPYKHFPKCAPKTKAKLMNHDNGKYEKFVQIMNFE